MDKEKILTIYFSESGNTEKVAKYINKKIGGDIIKLETKNPYPTNYRELVNISVKEKKENARPELKTKIDDINKYDLIIIGYPNWCGDMPMPIYTFLEEYDFSKKTIAPFITHGGSGLSKTVENIRKEVPNAKVTEGLAVNPRTDNIEEVVDKWLAET